MYAVQANLHKSNYLSQMLFAQHENDIFNLRRINQPPLPPV